jgi:hypothetical protein
MTNNASRMNGAVKDCATRGCPAEADRARHAATSKPPRVRRRICWPTGSEGRITCLKRRVGLHHTRLDGIDGVRTWFGTACSTTTSSTPAATSNSSTTAPATNRVCRVEDQHETLRWPHPCFFRSNRQTEESQVRLGSVRSAVRLTRIRILALGLRRPTVHP